jgi:hypothetical protein
VKIQVEHLCKDIVEVHRDLIKLGKRKPPSDPEVVKLGQRFDKLLDEYLQIAKK